MLLIPSRFPMQFLTIARIYHHFDDTISLRDVWWVMDGELNEQAKVASAHLTDNRELADLHSEVAWLSQALIEFADLLSFFKSGEKGPFQHKNYLYFETIQTLREATVAMLNGSPRASTGLLRAVLEMTLLHCYWQKSIEKTGSSKRFYDWLNGRKLKPKFRDVLANNLKWLEIPAAEMSKDEVQRTYDQLCAYVHAPIHKESLTMLNQGNIGGVSTGVLCNWLVLARDALRIALHQFVHLYPQCLFPVDITKKFGFNPPAGMYFDKFNMVPLKAVFNDSQIESWTSRLKCHPTVEFALDFHNSRPNLTKERILQSWDNSEEFDGKGRETDDPAVLWLKAKLEMRAISMATAYSRPLTPVF